MTSLLETPQKQFILPDEVDFIFDNTPLSAEDHELMAQMIAELKLHDQTPPVKIRIADEGSFIDNTPQSALEKRQVEEDIKKTKAKIRRRELYAARKTQNVVFTEGV